MSRPNKVWFRTDVGWWMVTLNGQRIRLAPLHAPPEHSEHSRMSP